MVKRQSSAEAERTEAVRPPASSNKREDRNLGELILSGLGIGLVLSSIYNYASGRVNEHFEGKDKPAAIEAIQEHVERFIGEPGEEDFGSESYHMVLIGGSLLLAESAIRKSRLSAIRSSVNATQPDVEPIGASDGVSMFEPPTEFSPNHPEVTVERIPEPTDMSIWQPPRQ